MAHELDMSNGQANVAFLGSRKDVWHRLGQEMQPGESLDSWRKRAGLDWECVQVPACADLSDARFDHLHRNVDTDHPDTIALARHHDVPGLRFHVRSDTGAALGRATDGYQAVQPADILAWFERYIDVDDRFALDAAGSLRGGKVIWATATFKQSMDVAGDKHVARLLMTTSFDCSSATINQATMTRVICANTLAASLASSKALVRTRHNTRFDAARVGAELAQIAQGFEAYKAMGDALALHVMTAQEVSAFFKATLEIEPQAKPNDISTQKMNQFKALGDAWKTTRAEGAEGAWAALNAVTRYCDHDMSVKRNGESIEAKRFESANFGHGADVKARAVGLLLPLIKDKVAAYA